GNATDALTMALMVLGIKSGDEVITSPFSFAATTEAICLLNAVPVFVDIDPNTYLIDANKISAAITRKTKAILPVSLFGQCADFDKINELANEKKIPVIEDAAQSFGATYKGRRSCSLSTLACTSFFPSKPLGCYGDGGACFTNDDIIAARLKKIRVHGQAMRYQHDLLGFNSRLDTLQAAILLEKLAIFPEEIAWRNSIARHYAKKLGSEIKVPFIHANNTSVYAQYTIETSQREELKAYLHMQGIPTAVHYPMPLYRQPAFQPYCHISDNLPHTEYATKHVLSLPMHAYLEKEEVDFITNTMKEYYVAELL
ncbi:MAG: DegT/DnrJ/EryC1/StrS family aminotransferase, partial [Rickettsiella sp.]|nr:DegT/DnrJ/EryC1/StrS family aminotransferase [Rickettsiella sp.]